MSRTKMVALSDAQKAALVHELSSMVGELQAHVNLLKRGEVSATYQGKCEQLNASGADITAAEAIIGATDEELIAMYGLKDR